LSSDRSIRFLHTLGGASTSRVLNLCHIAKSAKNDPEYAEKPLFRSPVINTAFIFKHRVRSDESYLFNSARTAATKVIVPFDLNDLRSGGRSIFIEQRGFEESLRQLGNYNSENLIRDLGVLRLINTIPSLDPFLLREHLLNNGIDVAPCYFDISASDQQNMHNFTAIELSRLIQLANGGGDNDASTHRLVSALLSNQVDEKLEPLRMSLGLTGNDFREGVFSWRGFLYYKWSMNQFWPDVMKVLREIKEICPHGAVTSEQNAYLTAAKRSIIELVRDNGLHVDKMLQAYDNSFPDLAAHQAPKTFRDFLLSAPHMFLELGEKMGAISHIVSFWRYRFPPGKPQHIDAEELSIIFQDFTSGFGEPNKGDGPVLKRPMVIEAG
jgi:hypothetical protein